MELKTDLVILRDFIHSDIETRVYWETAENEWQLWDAPWEYEGKEKYELRRDLEEYKTKMLLWVVEQKGENDLRTGFQICINDDTKTYIGWCNSYNINDNFKITQTGPSSVLTVFFEYPFRLLSLVFSILSYFP